MDTVSHSIDTDEPTTADADRHADRLAALGQLAAGVAHEINNPAAFVSANMTVVAEHVDAFAAVFRLLREMSAGDRTMGPKVQRLLEAYDVDVILQDLREIVIENHDGMGRIGAIARDLGGFSRTRHDPIRDVHPNEVVNAACSLVNTNVRHRATLVKELGDTPLIRVDAGALTQVLTNLLLNAAQATPEGDSRAHRIVVSTSVRDGAVVFSVQDDGTGIPEHVLPRIFEPFYTTKPKGEGTGLGLALTRRIVEEHAGRIAARSGPGEGAVFDVTIPASPEAAKKEPEVVDHERPTPAPHGKRVLIVDDDPLLLRSYARALGGVLEVVTANGGEAALEVIALDTDFDVVLCDLMMPDVDGEAVYQRVSDQQPDLAERFVFVSGGAFSPRAQRFLASVANPFLEKPIEPPELGRTIARLVAR